MIVKLLTEHHLDFLSLKEGCRGSSESKLVKATNKMKRALARGNLSLTQADKCLCYSLFGKYHI